LRILVPETVQGRRGVCFGCGADLQIPVQHEPGSAQLAEFRPGERVDDRYVIEAQIGRGGMGVVYKAHDVLIDEPVAVKIMNMYMVRTQRGQRLFIKEAQIARRLRHDNIVAVHDVSTTNEGVLYLTMELLQGRRLRDMLREHREQRRLVNVRFAIDVGLQILSALQYAHRFVVHRDLKPENVMILPGERVKVLDFGLALGVQDEELEKENADGTKKPGPIVGTTAYAAPEQKNGWAVDYRADLYTVGLLLYELLTLRTPVDPEVRIEDVRQDVSPTIREIIAKSREEDRDNRWQSAGVFHRALQDAYDKAYRKQAPVVVKSADGKTASTENMVYLEGGSFLMGNNHVNTEKPEFEAEVEPFYIDVHPVTNEAYQFYIDDTGAPEPATWHDASLNGPEQPVTGVSYDEAAAYAAWAGKELPTEKQWEFAARGRENRVYPWGSIEPDSTRCNFNDYLNMPSIVTMHESGATPDGVLDLSGNVYEWTRDAFVPYSSGDRGDNTRVDAPRRVVRGGSWESPANELRTSHRLGLFPESRMPTVGFRCVVPASKT
jgi:serine/threonine-protein kinase